MILRGVQTLLLLAMFVLPWLMFRRAGNAGGLAFLGWTLAFLGIFTLVTRLVALRDPVRAQDLADRTRTWWWMAGYFFVAMALDRWVTFSFLALLSFWSLREFYSLLPMTTAGTKGLLRREDRPAIFMSYASIPVMYWLAYTRWYNLFVIIVPVYLGLLLPLLGVLSRRSEGYITRVSVMQWGSLVFVFLLGHQAFLVNLSPLLFIYAVFLTELRDVAAYLAGRLTDPLVARHPRSRFWRVYGWKVAGEISPRKNLGSILLAALATVGLALALAPALPPFPRGALIREHVLLLGAAAGLLGAVGDLVGSAFKRDLGLKDSGSSLPGHGGVIDRLGSLAFTLPLIFHLAKYHYFPQDING